MGTTAFNGSGVSVIVARPQPSALNTALEDLDKPRPSPSPVKLMGLSA